MFLLGTGGVDGVITWSRFTFLLSLFSGRKVCKFPFDAWALSQYQNEPGRQSPFGLLAPQNLVTWLDTPPIPPFGRDPEGTPDNYQAHKVAQKHTLLWHDKSTPLN